MARPVNQSAIAHEPMLPSEVHGNLEFGAAQPRHEPVLRGLLRNNPVPGWISLAYQREPDFYHAAAIEGDQHHTIVCVDNNRQQLVGLSTHSVQKRFVNGKAVNVGYLGQLRVDSGYRNQLRPLKYGFDYFYRHLHSDGSSPYYLTSIIADNIRAKRILTARLPGFPVYREIDTFNTLAIPCKTHKLANNVRGLCVRKADKQHLDAIVDCLYRNNQRYQFSSCWTRQDLLSPVRCRDLRIDDYFIALRDDKVVACLACWDQSGFKQTMVNDYNKPVQYGRPFINAVARVLGYPQLPRIGEEVKQVYISHLAVDDDDSEVVIQLLKAALHSANVSGHKLLLVGFSTSNPMLPVIRKAFRHIVYTSQIYLVHWEGGGAAIADIDNRIVHMDIALL